MTEWLREYLPIVAGLGVIGLLALIMLIDMFIYPILNDPRKKEER